MRRGCVRLPRLPVCPPAWPLPPSESVPVLTPFSGPSLNQTPSPALLGGAPPPAQSRRVAPRERATSLPLRCPVQWLQLLCLVLAAAVAFVFPKKCLSSAFSHRFVTLKYIVLVLANLTSVVVRGVVYFICIFLSGCCFVFLRFLFEGRRGGSVLRHLPWPRVMISGPWNGVLPRALCAAGSLLPLCPCSCSCSRCFFLCQINK